MARSAAEIRRRARQLQHRGRRRSRLLNVRLDRRTLAVAGVILVLVLAAAGGTKAGRHAAGKVAAEAASVTATVTGGDNLNTPDGWADALLAAMSWPHTSCNFNAMTTWESREGGGFGNQAAYNPLNVNPPADTPWPGSPAIGAWAFPDAKDGLTYTVQTLSNGDYGAIDAAFRVGTSAQADCDAIEDSPWATSHYGYDLTAAC